MFDSSAILLYLADKTGQFTGTPADRAELLSWLFFIGTGLGPFSGQAVHFQHAAPEKLPYATNRYRREAERHYQVLEDHMAGRAFIVGSGYTIADMSAWGWLGRAARVLPGDADPLAAFPNLHRWFQSIEARPAVARAKAVGQSHAFKKEVDEESRPRLVPVELSGGAIGLSWMGGAAPRQRGPRRLLTAAPRSRPCRSPTRLREFFRRGIHKTHSR